MNIGKKLNVTLILVLICTVLMIAAAYAWVTLSVSPEVNSVDTNIGANGSLEIALLTEKTYVDPLQIRTAIGDSAVEQDALESNQSWGNVIELNDDRYGLSKISLLPARLNVSESGSISGNMLKTAKYGVDGRMTILSDETVSAVFGEKDFTFYVNQQRYGVRAIGTISNLSAQQTALAQARAAVKAHTVAASRQVKHTWRDQGDEMMDILFRHYSLGSDSFNTADVESIRNMANAMLEVVDYVDAALRQGIIGVAASKISDEPDFEDLCARVNNTATPLSTLVSALGPDAPEEFSDWAAQVDDMKNQLKVAVANSYAIPNGGGWSQIEPMLDVIVDGETAFLGEEKLGSKAAFDTMTEDNVLTLAPNSGVLAKLAAYCGNYSAHTMWTEAINVEARTVDTNETAHLLRLERILASCKAAVGGWTRANLDDVYGYAVDMAFRCNTESDLLLQTDAAVRVTGNDQTAATQGSGSYMRFTSQTLEKEQLLQLMDTIRVGFVDDKNTLLGVAKANVFSYEEQEEGIFAPLYLYDYTVSESGIITVTERRDENAKIRSLPSNSPVVVSVVVWLDGDSVDNTMVSDSSHQSMEGVLNLQFSSSADLLPADIPLENKK